MSQNSAFWLCTRCSGGIINLHVLTVSCAVAGKLDVSHTIGQVLLSCQCFCLGHHSPRPTGLLQAIQTLQMHSASLQALQLGIKT